MNQSIRGFRRVTVCLGTHGYVKLQFCCDFESFLPMRRKPLNINQGRALEYINSSCPPDHRTMLHAYKSAKYHQPGAETTMDACRNVDAKFRMDLSHLLKIVDIRYGIAVACAVQTS
eukprot:2867809-Amphidinium_carterae.1